MDYRWQDKRHEIRIGQFTRVSTNRGVLAKNPWLEELSHWPGSIQYEPCPPAVRRKFYRVVAKWAQSIGAKGIGGPVMSGAMLASGIAAVSSRLRPFMIEKESTQGPRRHTKRPVRGDFATPFVIVDDLICTARDIESALGITGLDGLSAILMMEDRFRLESKPAEIPLTCEALKKGLIHGISFRADPPHEEW